MMMPFVISISYFLNLFYKLIQRAWEDHGDRKEVWEAEGIRERNGRANAAWRKPENVNAFKKIIFPVRFFDLVLLLERCVLVLR